MSGHSRWATIKRKKGAADAKRGQLYTKLVREITTAARMGGGDADANPRLRGAIASAKAQRMPTENIERAIKKGTGALEGPPVEEIVYEGYGPAGVAFYVLVQTDNKNRSISEVRSSFTKMGGNLGTSNSVAWMFHNKGQIVFDAHKYTEEAILDIALEAGAEDVKTESSAIVVTTEFKDFAYVLDAFEKLNLDYESAELVMIPENLVKVSGSDAEKVLRLYERLDELDDVQKVYGNFDIDEQELENLAGR